MTIFPKLRTAVICACFVLSLGTVVAQAETSGEWGPVTAPAAAAHPAEQKPPVEPAPAEATSTPEPAPTADGKTHETAASEDASAPHGVAEAAEAAPASESEPEAAAEHKKAPKPAKPAKVKAQKPASAQDDAPLFDLGIRLALGVSGLGGHIGLYDERDPFYYTPRLMPNVGMSAGLTAAKSVTDIIDVVVELQYSLYRTYGEYVREIGREYRPLFYTGVTLHAIEMPIMARYIFIENVYAEAGIVPGANVYASIYKGSERFKPSNFNYFAFGATAGVGFEFNNVLVGVRGYCNFLKYDDKLNGLPWSAQVSFTKIFLN